MVPDQHLCVPGPPSTDLETQHFRHSGELLSRHFRQTEFLLEDATEPQDLLQAWELLPVQALLLKGLELGGLVRKLVIGRIANLPRPLEHNLLPELRHLLFRLQLPCKRCVVVLPFEERRWQHVREESQEEGQEHLRKGNYDEEGKGDELEAVRGRPHKQAALANSERIALRDARHKDVRSAKVGAKQAEARHHPLHEVHHRITDVFVPLCDDPRVAQECHD
mmetsp:Transcript_87359/g.187332  ORF Transcript_87359/g.187332 Transcript_87359/m.187332 type:complete len:222 (+) Transcript_87359:1009-1674(+)